MKTCFVIMPYENKLSTYYSKIIKPVMEEMRYSVIRADEIYGIQPIIDDITNGIKNADVLIADVTGRNPNVNYELGYAHALNKDVVIISQNIDDIPFDYKHRRSIIYDVTMVDWQEKLVDSLHNTVKVLEKKIHNQNAEKLSSKANIYEISYGEMPSKASIRYGGMFIKLSARAGAISQFMIDAVIEIADDINRVQLDMDELLSLRGAWFDDKYGNIVFFVDYLYDHNRKPSFCDESIKEKFHDGYAYYQRQGITIEPKCIMEMFSSDSFFVNSDKYYDRVY